MRINQNSQIINAQVQPKKTNNEKNTAESKEGVAAVVEKMHMDITDQGSGKITNSLDASKLAMSLKDRMMASASQAVSAQANVNPDFVSSIL